ncbi:hypothetical protein [Arthrobacter bambusae]|uniref:Uncharacterized protein n=1 Tax=Arthrobacter bambusae TaxID=1338426 RepID=A0AAW8DKW1_9MICC|nr:hypothetical protein [Arthrobacter bambusae]MDP9907077.1 hypothetical protein [Arthrobacter bambusae]MDQ0131966.1 hypothetical protein [Arthrobacter bambusae]MDQ0183311.1 hypothetical protein [Arthrobacter bambusae]
MVHTPVQLPLWGLALGWLLVGIYLRSHRLFALMTVCALPGLAARAMSTLFAEPLHLTASQQTGLSIFSSIWIYLTLILFVGIRRMAGPG